MKIFILIIKKLMSKIKIKNSIILELKIIVTKLVKRNLI